MNTREEWAVEVIRSVPGLMHPTDNGAVIFAHRVWSLADQLVRIGALGEMTDEERTRQIRALLDDGPGQAKGLNQ